MGDEVLSGNLDLRVTVPGAAYGRSVWPGFRLVARRRAASRRQVQGVRLPIVVPNPIP